MQLDLPTYLKIWRHMWMLSYQTELDIFFFKKHFHDIFWILVCHLNTANPVDFVSQDKIIFYLCKKSMWVRLGTPYLASVHPSSLWPMSSTSHKLIQLCRSLNICFDFDFFSTAQYWEKKSYWSKVFLDWFIICFDQLETICKTFKTDIQ